MFRMLSQVMTMMMKEKRKKKLKKGKERKRPNWTRIKCNHLLSWLIKCLSLLFNFPHYSDFSSDLSSILSLDVLFNTICPILYQNPTILTLWKLVPCIGTFHEKPMLFINSPISGNTFVIILVWTKTIIYVIVIHYHIILLYVH